MDHSVQLQLIEEPQWVSYCVEQRCSFRNHEQSFICEKHLSRHLCSAFRCSLIRMMAKSRRDLNSAEPDAHSCPVMDLHEFKKPDLEFRGTEDAQRSGRYEERGYGTVGRTRRARSGNAIGAELTENLKTSLLRAAACVVTALFATVLSSGFKRRYQTEKRSHRYTAVHPKAGIRGESWSSKVSELAKDIQSTRTPSLPCRAENASVLRRAVLKTLIATSALFDSSERKVDRFMKKLVRRYKQSTWIEFCTMVVMLTLCLFPYLNHCTLGELYDDRTLVIMCFDKTRTRHKQWSALSACIHLHANHTELLKNVQADSRLGDFLPAVITVTLGNMLENASYRDETDLDTPGLDEQEELFPATGDLTDQSVAQEGE